MPPVAATFLAFVAALFQSRASLHLDNLALRHQVMVYQQTVHRLRLRPTDHLFWAWLSRVWSDWREALVFVQPRTVIAWQQKRFREHWTRLSRHGKPGRPAVAKEVWRLIHRMSLANPTWGVPRIVGELRKLGIHVAKSTVEKYRVRPRKPPSPTWKAFLKNHVQDSVSLDFFVVPTVTHKILFVLLILAHHRRCVVHFKVTEHPTALKQRLQHEHDGHETPRLQMLYLLVSRQAHTRQDVARMLGVHRNTISRWLALYAAGGLEALAGDIHPPGQTGLAGPGRARQPGADAAPSGRLRLV